ncbi:Rho GDP-dissociation inhibitor domain-containing protein [Rozella allomycis CSF55]|uniref:Rho GDP-dissociation inhibitor domain-containing protein n=1 Tax=Rozella allomycis (strain CSF55) TaxID=988480 RepID=A0A075AYH0_ROZAC|nr:Rho GDP-dissociation inhibitor domain-containing protein [Rozella allomycis CSF55]|eukprot:EPZ35375.1 Rho GDP-dissociation inhibitor domain-containing protein [Rozella allomycis CSF55]
MTVPNVPLTNDEEDLRPSETIGYKPPEKKTIEELKMMDGDDESLTKWKQTLLKSVSNTKSNKPVLIAKLAMESEGRPDYQIEELKNKVFVVKEGIDFRLKVTFYVNNDVIPGLKYIQVMKRKGIKVDKMEEMIGSYGPSDEPYTKSFSPETLPSGMAIILFDRDLWMMIKIVILTLRGTLKSKKIGKVRKDQRNQIVDQRDRIQSVLDMIKTNTKLDYQEIRIPFGTRSVDCIRVIRDNQVYVIPSVLGVAGDTIEMAYGEIACCKMRLMTDTKDSVFNSREFILEKGEYLKPDSLCSFYGSRDKMSQLSGRYKFVLMETPFVSVLSETLKCKRPEPLLEYQLFKQFDVVWVLYYPWLVCFPLFPFSFLITFYVFKAYGNARISILFEVLKKEKTPYELYDLGEDEFDIEAGPPTKDVVLPFNQVLKKVLKLTFFKDKQSLTNSTHLLESLASVSVMCFVDKIGVLTHPYPSAKSLMFINNTSSTESIDVHLDSQNGYIFQENLWKERLTKDLHRKLSALTNYGSCPTSRQWSYQLLSQGNVDLTLKLCSDYWNGKELIPLDESTRKRISEYYQNAASNDEQCIALSFRPLKEKIINDSPLYLEMTFEQENGEERMEMISDQVFLGIVNLGNLIKENVTEFIEDLGVAGIRFSYFSPVGERESKAFAEKLGLETDWNCCILLSTPHEEYASQADYLDSSYIKARMPRGVENIRNHLKTVDDIPLHVSIFAECKLENTKDMIKLYQEFGEVVCCVGSALHMDNASLFAVSDVSVAMEPLFMRPANIKKKEINSNVLSSALISLPSAMFMPFESSPYVLTEVIREARCLMQNGIQIFALFIGSQLSVSISNLLCLLLTLPPCFTGYQIIWIQWFILPLLSLSLIFLPYDPNILKTIPVKNKNHLKDFFRFIWYFCLRFIPSSILTAIIYSL